MICRSLFHGLLLSFLLNTSYSGLVGDGSNIMEYGANEHPTLKKNAMSKARHPLCDRNPKSRFYPSDLDLDPMTLILRLDLDMMKMSHQPKNDISMSRHSKVITQTDRHTDSLKTLPSAYAGGKNEALET